jgi:hypothetical protein
MPSNRQTKERGPPRKRLANSAGKIAPGIDVRGTGGYIIAPPSIHPSGRAYIWSVDSTKAFALPPQWLNVTDLEPQSPI